MLPYAKRKINITIRLAEGEFGDKEGPEITLTGLRASVGVLAYNGDAQGVLQLRAYGMRLDRINQLTTIGPIMTQRRNNRITVTAGDEGGAMATVYEGVIDSAYGDFQGSPEAVFNVVALSAGLDAIKAVPPSSYRGGVDAAVIMEDLARSMGCSYENNGVSRMLSDPYFPGTNLEQVRACARAAGVYYTIERGKLAIWPKTGYREGKPIKIGPQSGMVGYPQFSSEGVAVTCLFNPSIVLGGRVEIDSDITVAKGVWNVYKFVHAIQSETPNGQWFTQVSCYRMEDVG